MRSVARAVALLVVAPFLTFASALAPQHVHEPGPGHEHAHAVAHSHFAPHDHSAAHAGNGIEIEHDDLDHGHIVWLDGSALHESPYRAAPPAPPVPVARETVLAETRWSVTPFDDTAPVHGPPKPSVPFRGPPPLLV